MVELIADHGLLVRADTRPQAEAAAQEWLDGRGVDLDDPIRALRAWWDGNGFVPEGHDGCEQVFVVNVPPPVLARIGRDAT